MISPWWFQSETHWWRMLASSMKRIENKWEHLNNGDCSATESKYAHRRNDDIPMTIPCNANMICMNPDWNQMEKDYHTLIMMRRIWHRFRLTVASIISIHSFIAFMRNIRDSTGMLRSRQCDIIDWDACAGSFLSHCAGVPSLSFNDYFSL